MGTHATCSKCALCQRTKRHVKKCDHLPAKLAEITPWETPCTDMMVPHEVHQGKPTLKSWAVVMIDPATGRFKIAEVPNTECADTVSNIIEQWWFCRCPWPQKVVVDCGAKFMAEFEQRLCNKCGTTCKLITKQTHNQIPLWNACIRQSET